MGSKPHRELKSRSVAQKLEQILGNIVSNHKRTLVQMSRLALCKLVLCRLHLVRVAVFLSSILFV